MKQDLIRLNIFGYNYNNLKSMKSRMLLYFIVAFSSCTKQQLSENDYPILPASPQQVELRDQFWTNRMDVSRQVTVPYCFTKCEETHRIANFEVAGGLREGTFEGIRYNDSDVFKIMEGAAYLLQQKYDPLTDNYLDDLIMKIAAAQEDDGYLYTIRTIRGDSAMTMREGRQRWAEVRNHSHELYNMGHMYEAAVAHYHATGKRNFLDIAIKNADLVASVYGPGKRHDAPGHQEIEIGLVKLYRTTGNKEYLNLARFFLDERGKSDIRNYSSGSPWENGAYWQDHKPVVEQDEAVGHAVRAVYMYSGMADVAALTGNQQYIDAIHKIWENVVCKKYYITGGIGALYDGEAFGENYQLPNRAYNETCAAIANVFWNHRMFLMNGESKYIDVLERTLYNAVLPGISFEGNTFFYPNVLEHDSKDPFNQGAAGRKPWFDCSCCPANLARFMPALPNYFYAQKEDEIFVNLYAASTVSFKIRNRDIQIEQHTEYPWEGNIRLVVSADKPVDFEMKLRIPGWAQNKPVPGDLYSYLPENEIPAQLFINNQPVAVEPEKGYVSLKRSWKPGDEIELVLPMAIKKVVPNKQITELAGKIAIERGPIVYCAEQADNPAGVLNLSLDEETSFSEVFEPNLLHGVVKLKSANGFTMIPYYSWSHRTPGEMAVWFKEATLKTAGASQLQRHN